MSLPPLGDLFALSDVDPAVVGATERSLRASGQFGCVWRPASEVVVALRDLPGPTTADATARELLELAFELHPSELVAPGTKRPLRAALAGLVPEFHLTRPDKGEASLGDAAHAASAVASTIPDAARPIVAPGWPPAAPLSYTDAFHVRQLGAMAAAVARVLAQRGAEGAHSSA